MISPDTYYANAFTHLRALGFQYQGAGAYTREGDPLTYVRLFEEYSAQPSLGHLRTADGRPAPCTQTHIPRSNPMIQLPKKTKAAPIVPLDQCQTVEEVRAHMPAATGKRPVTPQLPGPGTTPLGMVPVKKGPAHKAFSEILAAHKALEASAAAPKPGAIDVADVLRAMKDNGGTVKIGLLMKVLNAPRHKVQQALDKLAAAGKVKHQLGATKGVAVWVCK